MTALEVCDGKPALLIPEVDAGSDEAETSGGISGTHV
jgi:hypothetical protein